VSLGKPLVRAVLLVLLGIALVPVAVHSYRGVQADECQDAAALHDVSRIEGSRPGEDRRSRRKPHRIQSSTGHVDSGVSGIAPLEFHVVRSFDPRRIYVHPHAMLERRFEPDDSQIEWLVDGGERIPVRRLEASDPLRGSLRRAFLLYVYDGRPVEDPFLAQLRGAVPQVLGGTRPLTLFLIAGDATPDQIGRVEDRARQWLSSAWRFYERTCIP
jgi:hypothetical protein